VGATGARAEKGVFPLGIRGRVVNGPDTRTQRGPKAKNIPHRMGPPEFLDSRF